MTLDVSYSKAMGYGEWIEVRALQIRIAEKIIAKSSLSSLPTLSTGMRSGSG